MTVQAEDPIVSHAYTGAGDYSYPFKLFNSYELQVTHIDTLGNRTVLTITTDYTVTKNSDYQGGTVTTTYSPTTGQLEIRSNVSYLQDKTFDPTEALKVNTLERALDKIVQRIQQLAYYIVNSISHPSYKGDWAESTEYQVGDLVVELDALYNCRKDHTSSSGGGAFLTDVSAGNWEIVLSQAEVASYLALPTIYSGDELKALRVSNSLSYELAHVVPKITSGTAGAHPIVKIDESDYELYDYPPIPMPRARFAYGGTDSIEIYGFGSYWIDGIGPVYIESTSGITYTLQNVSGTSYWHYIYLDTSAITQRNLDAATYFTDSNVSPTLNPIGKRAWYASSNRAIFVVWIDSAGNIKPFYHNHDDIVYFGSYVVLRSSTAMSGSWETVSCNACCPEVCTELIITARMVDTVTANAALSERPAGATTTVGMMVAQTAAAYSSTTSAYKRTLTGSVRSIDFYSTGGSNTYLAIDGNAFILPPHF